MNNKYKICNLRFPNIKKIIKVFWIVYNKNKIKKKFFKNNWIYKKNNYRINFKKVTF